MEENIIKLEVTLDRIFYPKNTCSVGSGEYAIFSANIKRFLKFDNVPDNLETGKIKLKGMVCNLEYGTTYKVFCKLVETHEIYGDTYEIIYINKCIDISDKDKQKEFLKNIINENTVDNLFDMYDDVIELLENADVPALVKVKGIGNSTALRIINAYEDGKDYSSIYMELGQLGLTATIIKKLVDHYRSPDTVVDIVRQRPYDLVNIDGIGFKKADEIAQKVGISKTSSSRIKAFLLFYLKEEAEAGKSYLHYSDLMSHLYDILGFIPEESISEAAKEMMDNKEVVVLNEGNIIALKYFYDLENNIKNELFRLQAGKIEDCIDINKITETKNEVDDFPKREYIPKEFKIDDWKSIINEVESEQGFKFTDEQLSAIKLSLDNNVITITGGAGVGKTSTANGICSLYRNYSISACALSGKASVRITEATGLEASTIHRLLGSVGGIFTYNKHNKLPTDIVLIDEATMINGSLFLSLLEAIPTGAKVIIMGDVQQLTPIGNCQVFADILNSNVLPICKLTKPHRQALRSGIIPTSIKVANQEQIFENQFEGNVILGELQDMELDIESQKDDLVNKIVKHFQSELQKWNNIMEVQVCVATRVRGDLSCYNLNNILQNIYNPRFKEGNEIEILLEKKKDEEAKKYIIREGDKVINTKNNYQCIDVDGQPCAIFNGNMGIVKSIEDDGICTVDFEGIGEVLLNSKSSKHLELAYACTCHKLQGSGFLSTIVGLSTNSFIMNNCEWLYTAITRAKKYCVLVGNNYAISKAIQSKEVITKQTFLEKFLKEPQYV